MGGGGSSDNYPLHYAKHFYIQGHIYTVQGPSKHEQVESIQLGPHCTGTPLYSTRSLEIWTSSIYTTWTSLYRDLSVQYKVPPHIDKFNLYNLDLIVQGPLCTVQGPARHGQVQSVQLGPHCTGTPLYSTRSLHTWTSSICTTWISLYRDPSVLYKVPPHMDKFNLYNLDLIVQGPLCTVQGPSTHGQVQSVQLGPHCTGTSLYSTRSLHTWTSSTCTTWTSLYRDPSMTCSNLYIMKHMRLDCWQAGGWHPTGLVF